MKLCVSNTISNVSPDKQRLPMSETVKTAVKAGFDEFDWGLDVPDLIADDWSDKLHRDYQTILDGGMKVRYGHLPFRYPFPEDEQGWERFKTATLRGMDFFKEIGVDCAVMHPDTTWLKRYNYQHEHNMAIKLLTPYAEYAHKIGLELVIENMRGAGFSAPPYLKRYCTEYADLITLADELGCGICWDTGHANISAQNQKEALLAIGSRLKMVHINDNFAEDDIHIAPFVGNADWQGVADGLREIGYAGSVNLEVGCNALPMELRDAYSAYLAAAAAKLRDMIEQK